MANAHLSSSDCSFMGPALEMKHGHVLDPENPESQTWEVSSCQRLVSSSPSLYRWRNWEQGEGSNCQVEPNFKFCVYYYTLFNVIHINNSNKWYLFICLLLHLPLIPFDAVIGPSPFYRNWSTEGLSNLPKETQLVSKYQIWGLTPSNLIWLSIYPSFRLLPHEFSYYSEMT